VNELKLSFLGAIGCHTILLNMKTKNEVAFLPNIHCL